MFTLVFKNEELCNKTGLIKVTHITHYVLVMPSTISNIVKLINNHTEKRRIFSSSSVR